MTSQPTRSPARVAHLVMLGSATPSQPWSRARSAARVHDLRASSPSAKPPMGRNPESSRASRECSPRTSSGFVRQNPLSRTTTSLRSDHRRIRSQFIRMTTIRKSPTPAAAPMKPRQATMVATARRPGFATAIPVATRPTNSARQATAPSIIDIGVNLKIGSAGRRPCLPGEMRRQRRVPLLQRGGRDREPTASMRRKSSQH